MLATLKMGLFTLAAIPSLEAMLSAIIYLVIAGMIFWAVWWFIQWIGVPEPFNKFALAILGLFALIVVINILLSLVGKGSLPW